MLQLNLWQGFYTLIFKTMHKLYTASGSATPDEKFWACISHHNTATWTVRWLTGGKYKQFTCHHQKTVKWKEWWLITGTHKQFTCHYRKPATQTEQILPVSRKTPPFLSYPTWKLKEIPLRIKYVASEKLQRQVYGQHIRQKTWGNYGICTVLLSQILSQVRVYV